MRRTDHHDFTKSARPILFYTGIDEFPLATYGGTAFVVSYIGRPYAITCKHVFKDFDVRQLALFATQSPTHNPTSAKIKMFCYPSSPTGPSADSEVTDFCVIEFDDAVSTDFFEGGAYPLNEQTICSSATHDRLVLFGAVKEKIVITPHSVTVGFGGLEARDAGPSADYFVRYGVAQYLDPPFSDPTGMSGSPTFNHTRNGLCGMVTRATLQKGRLNFMYAEASDLLRFVVGAAERRPNISYAKQPPA